jgi:uncharacterized membrane protein
MDETLKPLAANVALGVQVIAAILIAFGALEAVAKVGRHVILRHPATGWRKEVFVGFGLWLLLGLQFALAADILGSLISPTWNDIGQLAAIAVIRTFLNYFLEKDLSDATDSSRGIVRSANGHGAAGEIEYA